MSRFNSQGFCDAEGFTPSKETVCYNSDELQKVNPRSPMGGKSTSRDGLDELLCVEKSNNFHKVCTKVFHIIALKVLIGKLL